MHKIIAMMYLSKCCFNVSHKLTFLIMQFCGHYCFVIHTNCRINFKKSKIMYAKMIKSPMFYVRFLSQLLNKELL